MFNNSASPSNTAPRLPAARVAKTVRACTADPYGLDSVNSRSQFSKIVTNIPIPAAGKGWATITLRAIKESGEVILALAA